MKSINEISRMNLSDLGDGDRQDLEEGTQKEEVRQTDGQELPEKDVQEAEGSLLMQDGKEEAKETEKEKMRQPQGEHYYIDARIGKDELAPFIRKHLFFAPSMALLVVIGVALLVFSLVSARQNLPYVLLYIVAIVILLPIMQYRKAMKSNLENPVYKDVLHYMIDEWGLHLEASSQAMDVEWKKFTGYGEFDNSIVLYTGKTNAFILPTKDMESPEKVKAFVKERVG